MALARAALLPGRRAHGAALALPRHLLRCVCTTTPAAAAAGKDLPDFPMARPSAGDPPREYARLRQECPVGRAKLFDGTPIWLITKLKVGTGSGGRPGGMKERKKRIREQAHR